MLLFTQEEVLEHWTSVVWAFTQEEVIEHWTSVVWAFTQEEVLTYVHCDIDNITEIIAYVFDHCDYTETVFSFFVYPNTCGLDHPDSLGRRVCITPYRVSTLMPKYNC